MCLARPSAVQGTQCLFVFFITAEGCDEKECLPRPKAVEGTVSFSHAPFGRRARERKTPILINEKVGHIVDSNPDQIITSPQSYPLDYHLVSLETIFDLPLILHNRRL